MLKKGSETSVASSHMAAGNMPSLVSEPNPISNDPDLDNNSPKKQQRSFFGGLFAGCCSADDQVIVYPPSEIICNNSSSNHQQEETPFQQRQREQLKTTQEWLAMLEAKQQENKKTTLHHEKENDSTSISQDDKDDDNDSSDPHQPHFTNKTMETNSTLPLGEENDDDDDDQGDPDFPYEDVAPPRSAPNGTFTPSSPEELQAVFGDLSFVSQPQPQSQPPLPTRARSGSVEVQFQRNVKQDGESELDFVLNQMHLQRKPVPEIEFCNNNNGGESHSSLQVSAMPHLSPRRASAPQIMVGVVKDKHNDMSTDDEIDEECFQHKTHEMYEDW
eukprot:CAMPEP_0168777140 /NCGR_PEP_ID=MMETSP0725-20121227/6401_1 /TAXON_ID=265536 /ORGANISM="Amphiprora sp., Strain CCMP467" /LENGTH=330 /DNA_ID=CAMNT_0008826845 /DNA_START=107 /DNA_END=1099 /DNA_ORIENTATION=-